MTFQLQTDPDHHTMVVPYPKIAAYAYIARLQRSCGRYRMRCEDGAYTVSFDGCVPVTFVRDAVALRQS